MLDPNGRVAQSTILFGSMVVALIVTFISSVLTARMLGPSGYGDVKFVQSFWVVGSLVSTFGLLQSGSRLLLLEREEIRSREITGIVLALSAAMGGVMAIGAAALAIPVDSLFHTDVSGIMLPLAPLVVALPLRDALGLLLQSANKIRSLAILNCAPAVLYLGCLALVPLVPVPRTMSVAFFQLFTPLVVSALIALRLRPRWSPVNKWLPALRNQNAIYGWPVYVGSLAGVASGHLNRMAIAYWVGNSSLGFYSLALSLVEPLKMIPNAVATSSYRQFAGQNRIQGRVLVATMGISMLSMAGAVVAFGLPMRWLYGESFSAVGPMARVAAAGAIAHGFGDFYNRFLGAHGHGNALRNAAFVVGGINALGVVLMVPLWGAWGAIGVSAAAGLGYLLFMLLNYARHASLPVPAEKAPAPAWAYAQRAADSRSDQEAW